MGRVLVFAGLIAAVFAIFSAVDCALTERSRVRALPKAAWVAVIVLLPVIGGVLWFVIGRSRPVTRAVTRPMGPDDDPTFLRSAGRRPAPPAPTPSPTDDEERFRQLEQELANLDSDADDDEEPRRR